MRLVRAAAIALLSLAVLLSAALAIAMRNQARLISLVLQHIQQQTGYQIVASSGGLHSVRISSFSSSIRSSSTTDAS